MKLVFNHNLVNSYSWLPKGITSSIININSKGRCSVVAAILSNGEYILQIFKSTIDSRLFWQFLWILNYAVKSTIKKRKDDIIINMDNAATHVSETTKKLLKLMKYPVQYLPPYWPHLAPIELFFIVIKTIIGSKFWNEIIDYNKNSGRDWIFRSWCSIDSKIISGLWICFVKDAKKCIISNSN